MEVRKITAAVEEAAKVGAYASCKYCTEDTLSIGDMVICAGCENVITYSQDVTDKHNVRLSQKMAQLHNLIASGDFKSAVEAYALEHAGAQEPQALYAEALLYIRYSNHETSLINHSLHGFMEENISHRNAAAATYSTARLKLNRVIRIVEAETSAGTRSILLDYTAFLSHIKLGELRAAGLLLDAMKSYDTPYVHAYAATVYAAANSDYAGILSNAEAFCSKGSFSISGLYYVSWALLKLGRKKEAKELALSLRKYLKNDSLEALIALMG